MKTKSSPSLYRYDISRLSTVAVSTLVPALNVLSTTFPDSTFFRVVRTKAPPLPGLTCWKFTTDHSWPSRLSTSPFFSSLVVATSACHFPVIISRASRARHDPEVLRGQGEELGLAVGDDEGVLDTHAAPVCQVDTRLDGDRHAWLQCTDAELRQRRSLVDLQADAVAETMDKVLAVPGLCNHLS